MNSLFKRAPKPAERAERTVYLRASIESSEAGIFVLGGQNHLVVPVVMLVEGVIQASNAPAPELALASEFGRFPAAWDGRPVVLGHPLDSEGIPISANQPELFDSQLGNIFNTRLEDKRLISEIFINVNRVSQIGGSTQATVDKIIAGETVEVSTGLFMTLDRQSGFYNGEKYQGVWTGIVPDHLAVLPEGVVGACSVMDGCGTNRINSHRGDIRMPASKDRVDKLVANCGGQFTESDRTWLSALTDEQIDKISAQRTTTQAPPPTKTEPTTLDKYIESAPAEIAAVLTESLRSHSARKAQLVGQIMQNKRNPFTKEQLEAKQLHDLEGLAVFAVGPDYSGAAGSSVISTMARAEETSVPPMEAFPRKATNLGRAADKGGTAEKGGA